MNNRSNSRHKTNIEHSTSRFDMLESKILQLIRHCLRLKKENKSMKDNIALLEKELRESKRNCLENNRKMEHWIAVEKENKRLHSERDRLCSRIEGMLENMEEAMKRTEQVTQ